MGARAVDRAQPGGGVTTPPLPLRYPATKSPRGAPALALRPAPAGLIHHSDRRVHYACGEYRALLDGNGITCSMSRKGDCWDNATG